MGKLEFVVQISFHRICSVEDIGAEHVDEFREDIEPDQKFVFRRSVAEREPFTDFHAGSVFDVMRFCRPLLDFDFKKCYAFVQVPCAFVPRAHQEQRRYHGRT